MSLAPQCLFYQLSRDNGLGFHSRVLLLPTAPLRIAFEVNQRLAGEGHTHKSGFPPSCPPQQMCHIRLEETWPRSRTFPKCTPEHNGGSVQLNLPCSNGFLPTRLPYVQKRLIARCMSKFSFLKCNFPQNLLASYNAASWLQRRLFCHLGQK